MPLLAAAQEPTPSKTFVYDQRSHDFGRIREQDGKVSHTFTFTNRGKKPVAISDVNAWCGCTTAEYTRGAIRPGAKARVTVTYNPYGRPGKFSKEVVVMLGDGSEYTRVWVKGDVAGFLHPVTEDYPYALGHSLYVGLSVMAFPGLHAGEQAEVEQRIANDTDRPMRIRFRRQPDNRVLKMPDTLLLAPRERRTLRATYRSPRSYRHNRYFLVYPSVDGKECKPIRVNLFGLDGKPFRN